MPFADHCLLLSFPKSVIIKVSLFFGIITMGPCPSGPIQIDGLLVSPGKSYTLLTDHLITG